MTAPLAVVVVTYSPGETLESFLTSVRRATTRPLDVVVVDNGSTDGAPQRAAAAHDDVRLVRMATNVGFGAAANRGITETDGEYVVVANPDIVWEPGSLDTLLEATARWPRGAAFGPLIRTPSGELYPSARQLPSLGRGIGHALVGWVWPGNPWTRAYRQEQRDPVEGPAGWLSGSCLLLLREAVESLGGFDEGFFMYFEDTDLGDRLGRAGWLNVHVPSAAVIHAGGHATRREPSKMQRAHHASAYRYLSRHYRGLRWLPVRLVLRLGLTARAALALRLPRLAAGAAPTRTVDSPPASPDASPVAAPAAPPVPSAQDERRRPVSE